MNEELAVNTDEIECFVVEWQLRPLDSFNKSFDKNEKSFYVSVYGECCLCSSKRFSSFEEVVMSLELKFPEIVVDCDAVHETVDKRWREFKVHGISEKVLRECLQKGEPLL